MSSTDTIIESIKKLLVDDDLTTLPGIVVRMLRGASSDSVRQALFKIDIPAGTYGEHESFEAFCEEASLFLSEGVLTVNDLDFIDDDRRLTRLRYPFFNTFVSTAGNNSIYPSELTCSIAGALRAPSSNCTKLKIDFRSWNEFDNDISNLDVPNDCDIDDSARIILATLKRTLETSYCDKHFRNASIGGEFKESHELAALSRIIPFGLFGCEMDVPANSAPDFQIKNKKNGEIIFVGEGKACQKLPLHEINADRSRDLCIFGFATAISRHAFRHDNDAAQKAQELYDKLPINDTAGETGIYESSTDDLPNVVKKILGYEHTDEFNEWTIDGVINGIRQELRDETSLIRKDDAVNLWGAVIQACAATVTAKKLYTMVLSSRTAWYIQIGTENENDCFIKISRGSCVGHQDFITEIGKFITLSQTNVADETYPFIENAFHIAPIRGGGGDGEENIDYSDGNEFISPKKDTFSSVRAISMDELQSDQARSPSNSSNSEMSDESRNDQTPSPPSMKKPRNIEMSDRTQMEWQRALAPVMMISNAPFDDNVSDDECVDTIAAIGVEKAKKNLSPKTASNLPQHKKKGLEEAGECVDSVELLGHDEFGPIPYLCQINSQIIRDIGYGRTGTVKEILWQGQNIALKEYRRDLKDYDKIFSHERSVLFQLKHLWGTRVPALLFHNPWVYCPSLGMQLGKPVIEGDEAKWDNIDEWEEKDKLALKETLDVLDSEGWEQRDHRGMNFVRLQNNDDNEYIAVIDMESMFRKGEEDPLGMMYL